MLGTWGSFSKQGRAAGKAQESSSNRLGEGHDLIWKRCWGDSGIILLDAEFGLGHFSQICLASLLLAWLLMGLNFCQEHRKHPSWSLSVKSCCLNLFSGWSGHCGLRCVGVTWCDVWDRAWEISAFCTSTAIHEITLVRKLFFKLTMSSYFLFVLWKAPPLCSLPRKPYLSPSHCEMVPSGQPTHRHYR